MSARKNSARRTPSPASLTVAEFQALSRIFRGWSESKAVRWCVITAALLDAAHILWLLFFWLAGRLR
jgi:hypothetical protein